MGSFSEILLSFNFASETPDHVLAAFASLQQPTGDDTPTLPPPVVEAWDAWSPTWRLAGYREGRGDPFEDQPWKHDWAAWTSTAMGVQTTPHGHLTWSTLGLWNLDCRFSWKTDPDTASEAMAWLGPYVDTKYTQRRVLVGYAHHEYALRPHLFWVEEGRWELEDLNPGDDWTW